MKSAHNQALPGTWLAGGLGLSFLLLASLMMQARVTIGPLNFGGVAVYSAGMALVALRYACRHGETHWRRVARDYSEDVGLFAAICLFGAMASYPVAAANHGFADARLDAIDHYLRFNWITWYDLVAAHPLLQLFGRTAYDSIFVTPAVVLGYFALTGRRSQARFFIASFWLAIMLTLLLFAFMPAEGPLAYLWHGPVPYRPISALYQAELIPALRDHALRSVDPGSLHGLVCAPSFHAVSAVLYTAAAWPCRRLRWPIVALNAAMLLATPVEGTHYLVDILLGVLVALVALGGGAALAKLARRRVVPSGEHIIIARTTAVAH